MRITLCPRCAGMWKNEWCFHCDDVKFVKMEDIDEEGETVLAIVEAIAPDLVERMYDESLYEKMAFGWRDSGETWRRYCLLNAMQQVLLGYPDEAWEDLAMAGDGTHCDEVWEEEPKPEKGPARRGRVERAPRLVVTPEGSYYEHRPY